jgi:hypothetical protein
MTTPDYNAGLERVFSEGHQFYDRIFYDVKEGSYYDRSTDFYLTLEEAHAFGIK